MEFYECDLPNAPACALSLLALSAPCRNSSTFNCPIFILCPTKPCSPGGMLLAEIPQGAHGHSVKNHLCLIEPCSHPSHLPGDSCQVLCTLTPLPAQVQQDAAEQDLPQGDTSGLFQLHAPSLLECWLPDGGPQLPNCG